MCGKAKVDTSAQDFAQAEAIRARAEEEARKARIAEGMKEIAGVFSDDKINPVLDARRQASNDFYYTDLDRQNADAKDELAFSLARSGQSTSSVAGEKKLDLSDIFQTNAARIQSQIDGDIASAKSGLNNNRSAIEAALRASGDASAAANSALATAATFRSDAPTLNPIGNVFLGLTDGIGASNNGFQTGNVIRSSGGSRPTSIRGRASRNVT